MDSGSSPKKDAANKLEHFDFTYKNIEFIQKLEGHQTATPTNAVLDWLCHAYTKRSFEQKMKSFIHEVILTNFLFKFEILM